MSREIDSLGECFSLAYPAADAPAIVPILKDWFMRRSYQREPFPHWQIPADHGAARLLAFAQAHRFTISQEARKLYASLFSDDEQPSKHPDRRAYLTTDDKGRDAIGLSFNYVPAINDRVKVLTGARLKESGDVARAWVLPLEAGADVLKLAEHFSFTITHELKGTLQHSQAKAAEVEAVTLRRRAALLAAARDVATGNFGGKTPRNYQAHGVSFLVQAGSALLGDDMGLGKTMQAALWARAFQRAFSARVIIVAPLSLIGDWQNEARDCGIAAEVFTWAKIPPPPDSPFVLIADEAHAAQDQHSQRSQAMMKLARSPHCLGALMVTGTPMRGARPENIFPLLRAVRHPLGDDWPLFERLYVGTNDGAERVMRKIASIYLRRTKEQVAKELPKKSVMIKRVEPGATERGEYEALMREARQRAKDRKDAKLPPDPGEMFKLLGQLRQIASAGKVEPTIEMAEEILDQQRPVIIFTEYLNSARRLAEHFTGRRVGVELLTGEAKNRQEMVKRFQSGKSRVWVSTIKAGGVGLTLTAASDVILLDQHWILDDNRQAGDRAHRIGQTRPVSIYWLRAFDVDASVQARLRIQEKALDRALNGGTSARAVSINEIALEVARELFEVKQ